MTCQEKFSFYKNLDKVQDKISLSAMVLSCSIPQDVVDIIISHPGDDNDALKQCSLISQCLFIVDEGANS